MHRTSHRVAFMTFRVVQHYGHLGLEPGDILYVRFGARRFTILAPDHTHRFIPANYGSVLGADLHGCLVQVAGLYMPETSLALRELI